MSYPSTLPGRRYFPGILVLLLALSAQGAPHVGNYSVSHTPNPSSNALYKVDTALHVHSGIVRHEKNGDIVIVLPPNAMGRYKIRFFDEQGTMLFEIRQIRDPLLIIEKYNFGHAGLFQYELYRDNGLVEKGSFKINP